MSMAAAGGGLSVGYLADTGLRRTGTSKDLSGATRGLLRQSRDVRDPEELWVRGTRHARPRPWSKSRKVTKKWAPVRMQANWKIQRADDGDRRRTRISACARQAREIFQRFATGRVCRRRLWSSRRGTLGADSAEQPVLVTNVHGLVATYVSRSFDIGNRAPLRWARHNRKNMAN